MLYQSLLVVFVLSALQWFWIIFSSIINGDITDIISGDTINGIGSALLFSSVRSHCYECFWPLFWLVEKAVARSIGLGVFAMD